MILAIVIAVIGSVLVRYGRLNSLEIITPSTPPDCRASSSSRARATTAAIPPALSYAGSPGRAARWSMAMTGFRTLKTSSSQVVVTSFLSQFFCCAGGSVASPCRRRR